MKSGCLNTLGQYCVHFAVALLGGGGGLVGVGVSRSLPVYGLLTGNLRVLVHGFIYILEVVCKNVVHYFGKLAVQRMNGWLAD